jgi:RepB DNA-primase from phage plasmid
MTENNNANETPTAKALAMLDAFAGIGVNMFDLTITNIKEDERGRQIVVGYDENQSISELRRRMQHLISDATRKQNNNIIRPHNPPGLTVVQLDDLDAAKVARVADHAFMVIRTSPGNHQAWLAVNDAPAETEAAKDFVRRLKRATGADATASGATRIAGGFNFKLKYAAAFSRIEITHEKPGHIASCNALTAAGLVAPQDAPRPSLPASSRPLTPGGRLSRKKVPSYQMCLQGAHRANGEDRPDISRVDFLFARTCAEWGWDVRHTAGFLMQFSPKAKTDGERYAMLTATKAAASVEINPYRQKSMPRPA